MSYRGNRLAVFLIFAGLGIFAFWVIWLLGGNLTEGLRTVENENYIVFHIAAELITAVLAFTGGVLWLSEHRRAPVFVMVALGMLIYTGLNSMAWGVRNDPVLSVFFGMVFIVGLIGLYWFAMGLISKPTGSG
ncbi:MAG: hypothetical protein RDV00_09715 [Clostridia bacterium]|nr:hypothetical protein [Clostridia bacterium]MDQ7792379.1 hypothetical protein [Clostridia bacterium]